MNWLRRKRWWVVGSLAVLSLSLFVWFILGLAKPTVRLLKIEEVKGIRMVEMEVNYNCLGHIVYGSFVKIRRRGKARPEEIPATWPINQQTVEFTGKTPPAKVRFSLPTGSANEPFEVGVVYVEYPLLSGYLPASWSPNRGMANTVWIKTIRP